MYHYYSEIFNKQYTTHKHGKLSQLYMQQIPNMFLYVVWKRQKTTVWITL